MGRFRRRERRIRKNPYNLFIRHAFYRIQSIAYFADSHNLKTRCRIR